ncbi:hypothetical protein [Streptomyces harbinensis]|uniref:hypothetical protein n=1 Tax=Streptomyces harbinensis TaxID=1176198 RepID=UPI0036CEC006
MSDMTWVLSPENVNAIDAAIDRDGVFAKPYWQPVDGRNTVVGMRIGERPNHVVAYWGDTIVRHGKGRYTVRAAADGAR